MRKFRFLVPFLTAAMLAGLAQTAAAGGTSTGHIVIKDPAEYKAYVAAANLTDPVQQAAAIETFVLTYPYSVVASDALEQAMADYQEAGNTSQVENTALRLIALKPDNVRAYAILTSLERTAATDGDAKAMAAMRGHAEQGLRHLAAWPKPDGLSDADYAKLRSQMTKIFNGAVGFADYSGKDYFGARDAYLKAVAVDSSNLQNVYQLGLCEVQMMPLDANGFWYLAKAIALAAAQNNLATQQSIAKFAKAKYTRYHGSEAGWDAIVAAASAQSGPPDGFAMSIVPALAPEK